jgi:hypothetical protein
MPSPSLSTQFSAPDGSVSGATNVEPNHHHLVGYGLPGPSQSGRSRCFSVIAGR